MSLEDKHRKYLVDWVYDAGPDSPRAKPVYEVSPAYRGARRVWIVGEDLKFSRLTEWVYFTPTRTRDAELVSVAGRD